MPPQRATDAACAVETGWRRRAHTIIYESDTPAGKAFDIALLLLIVASVGVVTLESLPSLTEDTQRRLYVLEWVFTIVFTVEYILRVVVVRRARVYTLSTYGIIDLVSILPTYLSVLVPGAQSFQAMRILRLLRVFRILRLMQFMNEASALRTALWASRTKIAIFAYTMAIAVVVLGTAMYFIESPVNAQFSSIPTSMYWTVVTMTTVGFGDIAPQTNAGRGVTVIMMLLGYSMLVVPTGIVTSELARPTLLPRSTQHCDACGCNMHESDARFCKRCGHALLD